MGSVRVIGNATLDIVQAVPRLPAAGETLLATAMLRCAGGKGLNQAVAAARTGARVHFAAPVGEDADGAFLRAAIEQEPRLEALWLPRALPSDLSVVWVAESGENVIVTGAACARSFGPDETAAIAAQARPGDIVLMQGNLDADATLAAARAARAAGALTMLNTAPVGEGYGELLGAFDVLIANEGEADALGIDAEALRGEGARAVMISLGARGAALMDEEGFALLPAPVVTAVDTAGAGDVLTGTLAGLLAQGMTLRPAAALAIRAASLSVTRAGTTPSFPSAEEIAALRREVPAAR